MKGLLLFSIVFVLSSNALAQPLISSKNITKQSLSLEFSMSPAFLIEFAYYNNVFKKNDVMLLTTLGSPIFLIKEFDSFRLETGAYTTWWERGNFSLAGGIFTTLATNENISGKFIAWGLEIVMQPGYYDKKWFAALNLVWKQTMATHIKHSEYVKSAFDDRYPADTPPEKMIDGPKDGWYGTPAKRWVSGLIGGYKIRKAITLYLGGGIIYTPNKQDIFLFGDVGLIPFYAQLGIIYHW